MARPKFRRVGIGTGTKVQQAQLRKLASKMAEDPEMIIPKCESECTKCGFDSTLSKIKRIQSMRKDAKALNKLAKGGKQFERGYASMLILAAEEVPIMFATARLPSGDVSFTMRGKVKKEVLIGFQHWDEPVLRLLAYSELATKKGLHLYSHDDHVSCSGKKPHFPEPLLAGLLRSSGYSLRKSGVDYACEHMAEHEGQSLRIRIVSSNISVELCKHCSSRKTNLYQELTARMLAKHPEKDFVITLEHDLKCISGDECTLATAGIGTTGLLERYRRGEVSDRELLDEYSQLARDSLANIGKPVFVLGNQCYDDDMDTFINALKPSEIEELALRRVLKAAPEPVVMDTGTPNAVLSIFWPKIGASAIYAVIGDKELARKIYADTKDSGKTPVQILRDAKIQSKSKNVLDALPDLKGLGRMGRHVDEIARTYKAVGREDILRILDKSGGDTKMKSINCGFLRALEALKGKEWQFTKEELDYGEYLAEFAKALLESKPSEYKEKLPNLLTASGSSETIEK